MKEKRDGGNAIGIAGIVLTVLFAIPTGMNLLGFETFGVLAPFLRVALYAAPIGLVAAGFLMGWWVRGWCGRRESEESIAKVEKDRDEKVSAAEKDRDEKVDAAEKDRDEKVSAARKERDEAVARCAALDLEARNLRFAMAQTVATNYILGAKAAGREPTPQETAERFASALAENGIPPDEVEFGPDGATDKATGRSVTWADVADLTFEDLAGMTWEDVAGMSQADLDALRRARGTASPEPRP